MKSVYLKGITTKKVLGYMILPGIFPRVRELFGSGFGYVAFLMAQIYSMVRLLPADHVYLNPANIGRFSVRNVIAEAARRLVIKRENTDQIFIFFALLAGAVLLLMQLVILLYSLLIAPALAQVDGGPFALFATPDPAGGEVLDIAFIMMDHVFGVPEFFCTIGDQCTDVLTGGPTPFHQGLHSLFQFYSLGILLIGVLIFLYFVIVVLIETASTGTPFGQRFQNVWVPIRLVVAIGLLLPINYGYSSGQYITFFAAKAGSGLASNAWNAFNNSIENSGTRAGINPTGEQETLIAKPKEQSIAPLVQAMSIVHACAYAYQRAYNLTTEPNMDVEDYKVTGYLINGNAESGPKAISLVDADFEQAVEFSGGADLRIRFGILDEIKYGQHEGSVEPTCGDVRVRVHSAGLADDAAGEGVYDDPLSMLTANYYTLVHGMWLSDTNLQDLAQRMTEIRIKRGVNRGEYPCDFAQDNEHFHQDAPACYTKNPKDSLRADVIATYQPSANMALMDAWEQLAAEAPFEITDEVKDRGWGGAGIWYNQIAQFNGAFISSVMDIPTLEQYPMVMEEVRRSNRASNAASDIMSEFDPYVSNPGAGQYVAVSLESGVGGLNMASVLNEVHLFWNGDGHGDIHSENAVGPNFITNAINLLLGTSGLFDMRNENSYTHPMAKLVGLGKGLVESAVRNIGGASATAFMGGAMGALGGQTGAAILKAASGMLKSTAFLGLTAGFILFYLIPFLPFIYVFFAVGAWIKTIFEAMVGVPLWALAHLRIDGEGLPGQAAENGYFLIFEILVRPLLVVFGLIAAITFFTAQARILNFIWDLVLFNVGGFSDHIDPEHPLPVVTKMGFKRSSVDEFFFTIIYTIIIYLMAMSSFKLIDMIPKGILRWIGTSASGFGDINEDPKDGLQRYAVTGSITMAPKLTGAIDQASEGIGRSVGGGLGQLGQMIRGPSANPQGGSNPTGQG